MTDLPVSVVVPTLGRPVLAACLRSLAACDPPPTEVVIAVQGDASAVRQTADEVGLVDARILVDAGSGVASNRNAGLRAATHPVVAVTDDDCTVAGDWVGVAASRAAAYPRAVLTGKVIPVGDPERVPSWKVAPDPHDFTGHPDPGVLYPNNMVLPRDAVLAFGGFDERFGPATAAEDCDFAYRWLRAGHGLRYEPSLVVQHHDWRDDAQLDQLFSRYAFGLGAVYGKNLRAGDWRVLRFLARDLRTSGRAARVRLRGDAVPRGWRHARAGELLKGVVHGVRGLGPSPASAAERAPRAS